MACPKRLLSKDAQRLGATLLYLVVSGAALGVGIWLVVTNAHAPAGDEFADLPFGCFVCCGVALLLAGKDLVKRRGLRPSLTPTPSARRMC